MNFSLCATLSNYYIPSWLYIPIDKTDRAHFFRILSEEGAVTREGESIDSAPEVYRYNIIFTQPKCPTHLYKYD